MLPAELSAPEPLPWAKLWVPGILAAVALCVRLLVDTDLGRDATVYLWMAERTLAGQPEALWNTVFHPGHPLMVAFAGWLFPGSPIEDVGRITACLLAALATVPLWVLGRRILGEAAATWGALLYAVGAGFALSPGEGLSEGAYWATMIPGVLLAGFGGPFRAGLGGGLLGLAYWVRPDAAAVFLAVILFRWLRGERRCAVWLVATGGTCVLWLVGMWWAWGPGPVVSAKLGFVWREGIGAPAEVDWSLLEQVLKAPGAALEGMGFLVLPLVLLGLWRGRGPRADGLPPAGRLLLWLPFVFLLVPIVLLKAHPRFFTVHGILLLPFAGAALHRGTQWLLREGGDTPPMTNRRLAWVLVLGVLGSELLRLDVSGPTKPYEVALGQALAGRLGGRDRDSVPVMAPPALVTDMPRVAFHAGVAPGPPKHRPRDEFLLAALRPETRWVAYLPKRSGEIGAELFRAGFRPVSASLLLPRGHRETIAALEERGVRVLRRP